MQANRYDEPIAAPRNLSYVPIDFNQLYRIGAAQKQAVDEATKELAGAVQTFGQFQSPSQRDTEMYYKKTIGQFSDLLDEAATNPDAMKDAAFRQRLQQRINNLDYTELSKYRQSREGMLARQKANQELMLRGAYNPLWHDVDFANYDTSVSGTFNDVSPLAYKSEVDLVKPFVDNLKASFMGVKNGWIHQGVSTDRTDYEIQKNLSSIQNTPEYQKHLEVLQRQGLSREDAEAQLNNTLITAGREFAYDQAERDPWWMESARLQAKYGQDKSAQGMNNLTTIVYRDAAKKFYENFSGLNPEQMNRVMQGGYNALTDEEKQQVSANMNPTRIKNVLRNGFEEVYKKSGYNINAGVNYVLDVMSSPLSPEAADTFAQIGTTKQKLAEGTYKANNSRNFILADELAFNMTGDSRILRNIKDTPGTNRKSRVPKHAKATIARAKFVRDWNSGDKFHDFIIAGDTKQVTDGRNAYQIKYAYIPIEQFSKEDYPDNDAIIKAGGQIVRLGNIETGTTTRTDGGEDIESVSTNVRDKSRQYVKIPVATAIPSSGEAAITQDAIYTKKIRGLGTEQVTTQNIRSELERMN